MAKWRAGKTCQVQSPREKRAYGGGGARLNTTSLQVLFSLKRKDGRLRGCVCMHVFFLIFLLWLRLKAVQRLFQIQSLKVRKTSSEFCQNMHIHYSRHTTCHSFKDLSTHTRIAKALHQAARMPLNQESMFTFPLSSWHNAGGCASQTCPLVSFCRIHNRRSSLWTSLWSSSPPKFCLPLSALLCAASSRCLIKTAAC